MEHSEKTLPEIREDYEDFYDQALCPVECYRDLLNRFPDTDESELSDFITKKYEFTDFKDELELTEGKLKDAETEIKRLRDLIDEYYSLSSKNLNNKAV